MFRLKHKSKLLMTLALLTNSLIGCGSSKSDKPSDILAKDPLNPYVVSPIDLRGQNAAFRHYIDFFERESGEVVDYPINFHSWVEKEYEKKTVLATCIRLYTGDRQILVIEGSWNSASELEREQLIFHEMAHCRYKMWEHNSNLIPYRFNTYGYTTMVPQSIMHPLSPVGFYEENREYYLAEIFEKDLPEIGVPLKPGCRDRTMEMYREEVCAKD